MAKLIKKIIIGPTQHEEALKKVFVTLLTETGIEDAKSKVIISNIPLRT